MDRCSPWRADAAAIRSTLIPQTRRSHRRWQSLLALAAAGLLMLGTTGCGGGEGTPAPTTANQGTSSVPTGDGPEYTVYKFLEAVRIGSDNTAAEMLTQLAREKTTESGNVVSPTGSDTARFEVTEYELVDEKTAHVAASWSDVGDNGQYQTDEVVWMLRKEPEGWRITGMATLLYPDMPPIILNFEDPQDMEQKLQLAEQEHLRRLQAATSQARLPGQPPLAPLASEGPLQGPVVTPGTGLPQQGLPQQGFPEQGFPQQTPMEGPSFAPASGLQR